MYTKVISEAEQIHTFSGVANIIKKVAQRHSALTRGAKYTIDLKDLTNAQTLMILIQWPYSKDKIRHNKELRIILTI